MKLHYFSVALAFLFISCSSSFDAFENDVAEFALSDNIISIEEQKIINAELSDNLSDRNFNRLLSNGKVDQVKLKNYYSRKGYKVESTSANQKSATHVNIYIENSGSMNGYINGNTQFKTAIQDLLVLLKYEFDERINIYFINSTIHPTNISSDLAHFASELNTKSFKVGDTGSSNLNSVFKQVLQKTSKDTMSILVSDCIYSIQGSKTEELLSTQKGLTKDAFLTKSRSEKLATTIVKLTSSFNGYYWDMNNKKTMLANELRPYYITIIGSDSSMATFNSKIEINENKVKGYNNKYALSSSVNENIFYSIVETEFDNGRYRTSRDNVNSNGIHSIENIASNGRNNEHFRFSVAVDLSSVSVTSPEIQNIKNYDADGFKVVSVFAISEIRDKFPQPTLTKISKMTTIPTHLLVLEAKSKKIRDTEIKFEKHIPNWVTETSIDNDTNILNIKGKTFGLSYLIEGISEAYEITSYSKYHFVLKLNLKN